jgi:hypothetical protein
LPSRPAYSGAKFYGGSNVTLVEIARINKDSRHADLPTRLTNALMRSCGSRSDAGELRGAAWTIFAELIDNIFSHSRTELDGYAALQVAEIDRGRSGIALSVAERCGGRWLGWSADGSDFAACSVTRGCSPSAARAEFSAAARFWSRTVSRAATHSGHLGGPGLAAENEPCRLGQPPRPPAFKSRSEHH